MHVFMLSQFTSCAVCEVLNLGLEGARSQSFYLQKLNLPKTKSVNFLFISKI